MILAETTEPLDPQSTNPDPLSSDKILDIHKSGHPRNGKIAKLPKEQRDQLNQMLAEGATGTAIIDAFARLGISLNHENVSNWRLGGHQDWLQHQALRDEMNVENESASDLFTNHDETSFHQVVIRLALTQIFQALKKRKLDDDPANYTRLLNSLSRLTREALCLRKYGDACAAARAQLQPQPQRDLKRKLTDDERRAIVRQVDEILGLASPETDTEASSEGGNSDLGGFSGQAPLVEPAASEGSASLSERAASAIQNPKSKVQSAGESVSAIKNPKSQIQNAAGFADSSSQIQNPKSKIQNDFPPEHCPHCKVLLPARPPNGIRPDLACNHCREPLPFLPMAGTQPPEFCPQCDLLLPSLLPSGQRPAPDCRCGATLPAPGTAAEQKADHCFECGARLPPLLANGDRPSPNCPACGTSLPPPPPVSAWVSEYCLFCGVRLRQPALTRHRIQDNCVICGCPLPPLPSSSSSSSSP